MTITVALAFDLLSTDDLHIGQRIYNRGKTQVVTSVSETSFTTTDEAPPTNSE